MIIAKQLQVYACIILLPLTFLACHSITIFATMRMIVLAYDFTGLSSSAIYKKVDLWKTKEDNTLKNKKA